MLQVQLARVESNWGLRAWPESWMLLPDNLWQSQPQSTLPLQCSSPGRLPLHIHIHSRPVLTQSGNKVRPFHLLEPT